MGRKPDPKPYQRLYNQVRSETRRLAQDSYCNPFKLLVTGSREWDDVTCVEAVLYGINGYIMSLGRSAHLTEGACTSGGADLIAYLTVEMNLMMAGHRWTTERVPAQWFDNWRVTGRNPGHERNQAMVDKGHDMCVGFPDPRRSPGTEDCMRRAHAAGIRTYLVRNVPRQGWGLYRYPAPTGSEPTDQDGFW